MNYFLTDEQKMIVELSRKIAEGKIQPKVKQYDESGEFPWDIVQEISRADLFRVYLPEEYGGLGGGIFELCLAVEELSKVCGGIALVLAATALGATPLLLFGSDEQKKRWLPAIASGEKLAAYAITEAEAGSDIANIKTTARRDGDYYILNGTKQWITNGGEAQIYTVFAVTDKSRGPRGISAFVVEKDTPGFSFGKKEDKLGIRASATRELVFSDCKIAKENLLSREGMGFIIAMKSFDRSRPGVAAQALGIAQGALNDAIEYAKQRVQFGQPISSFQSIQHMVAELALQIESARALLYATAKMIDAGEKHFAKESAMCKTLASDVAVQVTTQALQIFGGYGYMKEYPMEKRFRDAKITQIYEGTNEIQRNIIALELLKQSKKQ